MQCKSGVETIFHGLALDLPSPRRKYFSKHTTPKSSIMWNTIIEFLRIGIVCCSFERKYVMKINIVRPRKRMFIVFFFYFFFLLFVICAVSTFCAVSWKSAWEFRRQILICSSYGWIIYYWSSNQTGFSVTEMWVLNWFVWKKLDFWYFYRVVYVPEGRE